ncbi:MAG: DUF3604 domain-containing protein [Candidatus Heimdallarchaeota archaeon]
MMAPDKHKAIYGHAKIRPNDAVIAGSYGTWTLTIAIGKHGIDDGGHIKVAWRDVTDWKQPQFQNASGPNYTTIETTGKAKIEVSFRKRGYIRPWRPCLTLTVFDGYLSEGDTVTIVYGETSNGSPGIKAQTFVEDTFEFHVLIDAFGTGKYVLIHDSPVLRIVSGEPAVMKVVAPSQTELELSIWAVVRIEDKWGNPTPNFQGNVHFTCSQSEAVLPPSYKFQAKDEGIRRFENIVFQKTGIWHLTAYESDSGLSGTSNPIAVHSEQLVKRLYWGDLHGQTEETVGTGTLDQYFRFAKGAGLDFVSHVGNDFQITRDHYKDTQRTVKEYHEPGKFITFLGYEWSGNTPAGGDHNVYFLKDDQQIYRSSHALVKDKSDEDTDRYPIMALLETFRGRSDVLVIPHIGGRHAILDYHEPSLTPFIEIASVHGHFEWFAREALAKKLIVGFIAGSDDHTCRPGSASPISKLEAVNGGLMGVYASELSRNSLWKAFKNRHVYATTGKRIILQVTCGDAIMGDRIAVDRPPTFHVEVIGTTSLERVDLFRGLESLYKPKLSDSDFHQSKIKIAWSGARVATRRRNTDWKGRITLEKGKILAAKEFAFDLPGEGIIEQNDHYVSWFSTTAGDIDGIILTLDAPMDASLSFNTEPAVFSFSLNQLSEPLVINAGKFDQEVRISRIPEKENPIAAIFDFTDQTIKRGLNLYYVRVVQNDGEKAWSSPIFVEFNI